MYKLKALGHNVLRRSPVATPQQNHAALYLRVSTPDQKPDLQYDGLRAYAERAGLTIVGEYCDTAVSGRREGLISLQDQIDTASPMGRAMFTIIGAMAELESSLISERVTAGMKAAAACGKHLGRPRLGSRLVEEIETLATSTNLSIRKIQEAVDGRASRGRIGEIARQARPHDQGGTRPLAPEGHP